MTAICPENQVTKQNKKLLILLVKTLNPDPMGGKNTCFSKLEEKHVLVPQIKVLKLKKKVLGLLQVGNIMLPWIQ